MLLENTFVPAMLIFFEERFQPCTAHFPAPSGKVEVVGPWKHPPWLPGILRLSWFNANAARECVLSMWETAPCVTAA
jgi:hypothetical protein